MENFAKLWEVLPPGVCSDDEEVPHSSPVRFEKVTPFWRNPAVQSFMCTWDYLDIALRYSPDGKPQGKGKFPRIRTQPVQPRKDYEAPVAKMLPENFYDPIWFATLDEDSRTVINAQPEVDLIFPDKIFL